MSGEYKEKYLELKDEFLAVKKRICKTQLSKNPQKLAEYERDIIVARNNIVLYLSSFVNNLESELQTYFRDELVYIRDKTIECFGKLELTIEVPRNLLKLIEPRPGAARIEEGKSADPNISTAQSGAQVNPLNSDTPPEVTGYADANESFNFDRFENKSNRSQHSNKSNESHQSNKSNKSQQSNKSNESHNSNNSNKSQHSNKRDESVHSNHSRQSDQSHNSNRSNHSNHSQNSNDSDMANPLTQVEFLRVAAQTINKNYDGDPLALNAFINSIELLAELSTDVLEPIFLRFVKSKLTGKALESIPTEVESIADITNALKAHIKPDNSKVIAGRMLALRVDRNKMVDFTQQAEQLADALQRSLIIEGISQAKAREMTIEKTVEVCRNAARSDLVKSVLAATPFDGPKEVIAKFVVESATEVKEKQILAFKQQQKRGNNSRGRGSKNSKNFQNFRNSNNNFNGNNSGGNNRGRGQGRGRGNGRGRNNYNNQNYNGNGYQEHYVRYAENAGGLPQGGWRADQQGYPQSGQQSNTQHVPYQRN